MPIAGGPGPDPWEQPPDDEPRVPRFLTVHPQGQSAIFNYVASVERRVESCESRNTALGARIADLERQVSDLHAMLFRPILP